MKFVRFLLILAALATASGSITEQQRAVVARKRAAAGCAPALADYRALANATYTIGAGTAYYPGLGNFFNTSSDANVCRIVIKLQRVGVPDGNLRVGIFEFNSGALSTFVAWSDNLVDTLDIPTIPTEIAFNFTTAPVTAAQTNYYAVLIPDTFQSNADSGNHIVVTTATASGSIECSAGPSCGPVEFGGPRGGAALLVEGQ